MASLPPADPTCPRVKNVLLLDSEGRRIAVKYFCKDWPTINAQSKYEKSVFTKTSRSNARGEAEITMFDNVIVVYKFVSDLNFYVTGAADENELILNSILTAFFESVQLLLRNNVEKKTVLENLDLVLLALDEIVADGGVPLETEPQVVAARASMRGAGEDIPLAEQTFSQALATAKEQLAKSLRA
ncbi:coatomer subunit zeta [Pycnococcus provasolii]|uniref:Coatomer subunit zeta n=1 Tax=Pycnococcus provasolii TaxID=41880 RepID=A0A7S2YW64_9CHLO|mmetsp:Transcript_13438/g.30786  ORF Transcript_13438/g.30786 Transcript_13438/m.30786 type:complete len:186 (+) Transcript_13438:114-671(+)|eukprot:CAMPEP_0198709798 /NCGR_PEP_ID=MMETSP1471-20131121/2141_1 /TAXON_ID=41880 /ORGANISM="Pycnococcus provasolii, Strain RCC733" /LENGTH=185 /DNA_ID=CAMNT_0044469291 /DNA_START=106 /DNA_END=663 /DNA_ORIENTATION=+